MIKLHVGCGTRKLPEPYINIDHRQEVEPDKLSDALSLCYNFGEHSVDEVYASHLLEHFKNPGLFLRECYNVLKYHGVLRLAVPDIRGITEAYCRGGVQLERLSGLIWGGHKYEGDVHYHGWDYEGLAQLLRVHKFFDVHPWNPEEIFPKAYHDISYARITNENGFSWSASLNVEAKRI